MISRGFARLLGAGVQGLVDFCPHFGAGLGTSAKDMPRLGSSGRTSRAGGSWPKKFESKLDGGVRLADPSIISIKPIRLCLLCDGVIVLVARVKKYRTQMDQGTVFLVKDNTTLSNNVNVGNCHVFLN